MPFSNIHSVLKNGILCFEEAKNMEHTSVADKEVQARRDEIRIPNGDKLHAYANSYFDARNPMMYKLKEQYETMCVLRISSDILDIKNAIVSDKNAACGFVRFYIPIDGINKLDYDTIFCECWLDKDEYEQKRKKYTKCAEVLIPKIISIDHIIGAYVANDLVKLRLTSLGFGLPIDLNPKMFFKG